MKNIFITGGTGFLGSLLISEILSSSGDVLHTLVRDKDGKTGEMRLFSTLEGQIGDKAFTTKIKDRIRTYTGDITHRGLGLSRGERCDLTKIVDVIYHCAATTDLNLPLGVARKLNVKSTRRVLDFAMSCKEKGRLKKVNHISTAYVAGDQRCVFKEEQLDLKQGFNNTYEKTKYEAEKLVHEYRRKGLDIDIFRPSIIVGRYTDGKTASFKMFYQPLHFCARGLFDKIPAKEHACPNMINIDTAAKAIFLIANSSHEQNMTYHIVSPKSVTCGFIMDVASEYFGFKRPEFVDPEEIDMKQEYTFTEEKILQPYIPYFNYITQFDMKNTKAALQGYNFVFPEFDKENLLRLFEYCDKVGFIKRKLARKV